MKDKENQIVLYRSPSGTVELKVNIEKETLWLNLNQIASLFGRDKSVISRHLSSIFKEKELDYLQTVAKNATVQKEGKKNVLREIEYYNLDAIISVGYRVNSKQATQFRIWATSVLREYIYNGVVLNEKRIKETALQRLAQLQKATTLLQGIIQTKVLNKSEAMGLLTVITEYANTWTVLQEYDEGILSKKGAKKKGNPIAYSDARDAVDTLKAKLMTRNRASELFGQERDSGFRSALQSIHQSFGGTEIYPSLEEKAAHLLYFIIKHHPFVDGNKRIGSFLFVLFLSKNNYLKKKNGETKINDNALVALALLIAESKANEKEIMVSLVTNLLQG